MMLRSSRCAGAVLVACLVLIAPASASEWPPSHAGLVFLWGDAAGFNLVRDADGAVVRDCTVELVGHAFLDRGYTMGLMPTEPPQVAGFRTDPEVGRALAEASRAAEALSIECTLAPWPTVDGGHAGVILDFGASAALPNLRLQQRGSRIELVLRSGERALATPVTLFDIAEQRGPGPWHLVVSIADGVATAYLDGAAVGPGMALRPAWEHFEVGALTFGMPCQPAADAAGPAARLRSWAGVLEGVALAARGLDAAAVQARHAAYQERLAAERMPAAGPFAVEAELLATSSIPDPATLTDYPRSLVLHHYRILAAPEGAPLAAGDEIVVQHWGVLGGSLVPWVAALEAGQRVDSLWLEAGHENDQLDAEPQQNDLDADVALLPLYVALAIGAERPPRPATPAAAE